MENKKAIKEQVNQGMSRNPMIRDYNSTNAARSLRLKKKVSVSEKMSREEKSSFDHSDPPSS